MEKKGNYKKAINKYLNCLEVIDTSSYENKNLEIVVKSNTSALIDKVPEYSDLVIIDNSMKIEYLDSVSIYSKKLIFEIKKNAAYKNNNYKEALSWFEKEVNEREKIQIAEHKNSIKEIYLKNELEKEKGYNINNQKLLSKSNLINKLLILLSFLFLALMGIQFLRLKTRRKHNGEISQKNKEISSAMHKITNLNNSLKEKNELLKQKNEVKNKELLDFATFKAAHDEQLKNIKSSFDNLSKKQSINPVDLKLIEYKLDELQADEDEHWISFKQKIEDAYPNFFSKLTLKHPNLSKREKFHLGYVLIGMSVKAVAEISFVTPTTVNSARYRVKKKLGLTKENHLKEYLIQIAQSISKEAKS